VAREFSEGSTVSEGDGSHARKLSPAGRIGRHQGPVRLHPRILRGRLHRRSEEDRHATLCIHGNDDQIVPIAASAEKAAKIVKGFQFKVYAGSSHGLAQPESDRFNTDVVAFVKA
jgi:pimeloyl-ACP methyl ester carboxylesterase